MIRTTLTLLSLLGLLLSVGLWGVSYWGIEYRGETGAFGSILGGSLIIGNFGVPPPAPRGCEPP